VLEQKRLPALPDEVRLLRQAASERNDELVSLSDSSPIESRRTLGFFSPRISSAIDGAHMRELE